MARQDRTLFGAQFVRQALAIICAWTIVAAGFAPAASAHDYGDDDDLDCSYHVDFGSVVPPASGAGSVTLTPVGSSSWNDFSPSSEDIPYWSTSGRSIIICTYKGDGQLMFPDHVRLSGGYGTTPLYLDLLVCEQHRYGCSLTDSIDGWAHFGIGGKVVVNRDQAAGSYEGLIVLTEVDD